MCLQLITFICPKLKMSIDFRDRKPIFAEKIIQSQKKIEKFCLEISWTWTIPERRLILK